MVKVCVIVTFYNQEKYARVCLDSIRNQTFDSFECICVDDSSSDNTLPILKGFEDIDTRFRIISNGVNLGNGARARNIGLDHMSECEYFMFVDGDDFLHPQAIELAYGAATGEAADIASFEPVPFEGDGGMEGFVFYDSDLLKEEVYENPLGLFLGKSKNLARANIWNKIYEYGKYRHLRYYPELYYEDDYMYTLQALALSKRHVRVNEILYFYRRHPDSITKRHLSEKYLTSAIARMKHTYDYFIKGNNIPAGLEDVFKMHMAVDAFRMIVSKTIRRTRDRGERERLVRMARDAFSELVASGGIDLKYLSLPKRVAAKLFIRGNIRLASVLIRGFL